MLKVKGGVFGVFAAMVAGGVVLGDGTTGWGRRRSSRWTPGVGR